MLLFYDIKPEEDRHGARIRLVRLLRKKGGIPIQRSTWLLPSLDEELMRLLEEIREKGGVIFLSEWKPIPLREIKKSGPIRVGVVIQGTRTIEEGIAERILRLLEGWGIKTEIKISGTMGRMAALSQGWEGDGKEFSLPSQALEELSKKNPDFLLLLTGCKSLENGVYMGRKIVENAKLVRLLRIPLTQVETAEGGTVIHWSGDPFLSEKLAKSLSLELRSPPPFTSRIERKGGRVYRKLMGVRPGEKILVNGYVVGESLSSNVTLIARDGRLEEILGGRKYPRGIQKVGKVDLAKATVKTLRTLRILGPKEARGEGRRGNRLVLIERADTSLEKARGAGMVITVGDDTTFITHEILSKLGIPVLGLIDGDADGLLEKSGGKEAGSNLYLVRVSAGKDDEAGRILKKRLFKGKPWIGMRGTPEEVGRKVVRILGELVREVVTL